MSATPYMRRLSAVERLWLVADRIEPPFVNQLVLEGEGPLDEGAWREAAARAAAANPGLRLVLRGWLGRSRWVDSGTPPPVRVVSGAAWDGHGPEGAPFLSEPLPVRQGPTAEILLVEGPLPRVVVRTHHAVADGRGTLLFVEDLFRALRGEAPLGAPDTVNDVELARELGGGEAAPRREDCLAPTGPAAAGEGGLRWRRVSLPGRPTLLLPRVALALARAARAHAQDNGDEGRVRLDIPVDLRPRRPALRATGNLTGMWHLELPPESDEASVAAALGALHASCAEAQMDRGLAALSHLPLGFMAWVGRHAIPRVQRRGRYLSSGVLSNLGRLPLERFQSPHFRARLGFFIPPGAGSQPFFLALCGHPAGVELVATSPRPLATDHRLEALLETLTRP